MKQAFFKEEYSNHTPFADLLKRVVAPYLYRPNCPDKRCYLLDSKFTPVKMGTKGEWANVICYSEQQCVGQGRQWGRSELDKDWGNYECLITAALRKSDFVNNQYPLTYGSLTTVHFPETSMWIRFYVHTDLPANCELPEALMRVQYLVNKTP